MPDDAKLGLVAGVAAVILGAVVYLPKSPATPATPEPEIVSTAILTPTASVPITLGPPIAPKSEPTAMTASFSRSATR